MKRRSTLRFDPGSRLDRFLEMEAIRQTAILARAREEADAALRSESCDLEPAWLFAEDAYFRH